MRSETGLSANELAAVLEQLPDGVIVVDRSGRPLVTNDVARRLMQVGADGSSAFGDCTLPLGRALRGENVPAAEYTVARGRGQEPLRLRVSGMPLRDAAGRITGAMSVITDVTDRVAEEELRRSQQRLRLAMEASRMATWDYDVDREQVEWTSEIGITENGQAVRSRASLLDGLVHIHPDDRAGVERAVRQALEHGRDVQLEARTAPGPDNGTRWLLIKGGVYRDEQGRPRRLTGIAIDITERKEAEVARHALVRGERLRALGEMASGIAHDLNQSLALITGYSDMARQELSQEMPDVSRVRDMVDITARAAIEGGQALRRMLSFVRTQELMADVERVDMGEVLADAARLTAPRWRDAPQAEGRPIDLLVEAEPDCAVDGSPAALREAITNLIFNAVDALPHGGSIQLSAYQSDHQVVVEVRDTGTGMPADVKARIFDPFFTTKGERGTGLGLPQVLTIIERHEGSVEVDSEPDRGTTFRLKFPSATLPKSTRGRDVTERPLPTPKRSIRILVVEDEEQLARMAGLVLTQRGHEVVVTSSGEEALSHLQQGGFDLIISDLGLGPGMNGWDLAQIAQDRWPATRFVLVTGWGAAIDPSEAQARGVSEVIAKPYRIADLRHIADRIAAAGPG